MRIGWNQSRAITAAVFTRAGQHPQDGAVQGMTMGLDVPPAPPALAGDPTLYLAVWLAGDGDDGTEIRLGDDDATDSFGMPMHLVGQRGRGALPRHPRAARSHHVPSPIGPDSR